MVRIMTTKGFVFCTLINQMFFAFALAGKSKYVWLIIIAFYFFPVKMMA